MERGDSADDLVPTAETLPSSAATARPPQQLGDRYRLIERLDEGAMGVVWIAEDTALHRRIAVKLLHDRFLGGDFQAQLAREARAMARLSHPNVVAVYDVGEREGRTFVAMELVEGASLARWLETPRRWEEVLEIFRGVAAGLAAAHAANVIHRDLKPSNILVGADGRPRIADFGVAHAGRLADVAVTDSTTGLIGSPAYMPPERLHGDPAGVRGDQFGFCAAFYEALHGRRPFEGDTIRALAAAIERGVPPPVREVPGWLHAVIARGLAADPAARWPSMAELAAALRGPAPRRTRRALVAVLGLGAIAAVAAIAAIVASGDPRAADPPADAAAAPVASAPVPVPIDAAPEPPEPIDAAPAKKTPVKQPKADSLAGLSREELKARFYELNDARKAAADAQDYRKASRIAEQMVPVALRYGAGPDGEYHKLSITYACLGGEEKRARSLYRKMPDFPHEKDVAVTICRRNGIELE